VASLLCSQEQNPLLQEQRSEELEDVVDVQGLDEGQEGHLRGTRGRGGLARAALGKGVGTEGQRYTLVCSLAQAITSEAGRPLRVG